MCLIQPILNAWLARAARTVARVWGPLLGLTPGCLHLGSTTLWGEVGAQAPLGVRERGPGSFLGGGKAGLSLLWGAGSGSGKVGPRLLWGDHKMSLLSVGSMLGRPAEAPGGGFEAAWSTDPHPDPGRESAAPWKGPAPCRLFTGRCPLTVTGLGPGGHVLPQGLRTSPLSASSALRGSEGRKLLHEVELLGRKEVWGVREKTAPAGSASKRQTL